MIRWIVVFSFIFVGWAQGGNTLTDNYITWTFDKEVWESAGDETHYQYGTYATGDYWIVGPVTITGISPSCTTGDGVTEHTASSGGVNFTPASGRIINGSMVNPTPGQTQGYDSSGPFWTASTNVGDDLPLLVAVNSSLISTESRAWTSSDRNIIKTAAILTVISEAAASGSFRPPYIGTDKSFVRNTSEIVWGNVGTIAPVENTPTIAQFTGGSVWPFSSATKGFFLGPVVEHVEDWYGQYFRPKDFCGHGYGGDFDRYINIAAWLLNTNASQEDKTSLMYGFLQFGIDDYAIVMSNPDQWWNNGAHNQGHKLPILFAGKVFDNATMTAVGAKSGDYLYDGDHEQGDPPSDMIQFGEDQVFYVDSLDVSITNGGTWVNYAGDAYDLPYSASHLNLPEWGIRHATNPEYWTNYWWYSNYRITVGGKFPLCALTALAMGIKTDWNQNSFFDYTDRLMFLTKYSGYPEFDSYGSEIPWNYWVRSDDGIDYATSYWIRLTWDTYRTDYGNLWTWPTLALIGDKEVVEGETVAFTLQDNDGYGTSTTDINGDSLTFALEEPIADPNMTLNASTGAFSWVTEDGDAGTHAVYFSAENNAGRKVYQGITITVADGTPPGPAVDPVLAAVGNQSFLLNQAVEVDVVDATDENGGDLTYSALRLPSGMTINSSTGAFSGTPTNPGRWSVRIIVTDPTGRTDYEDITIEIHNGTHPIPFLKGS